MATITVPSAHGGAPLIFTVTGTSTINQGTAFQNAVGNATVNVLSDSTAAATSVAARPDAPASPVLNEIFSNATGPANSNGTMYTLTTGGEYTLIDVGTGTTVTGSADGGDTVLGTGVATYDATGDGNSVTFLTGLNTYNGNSASGDTITSGSGADTINTGTGPDTVFSGSGTTQINLNDTVPGDLVFLGDGNSTVNANGVSDTVVAYTNGQTIFGGTSTDGTLVVSIGDNATSTGAAGDVITAGAGITDVFDSVGGNSIFGGSGTLAFVGGVPAMGNVVVDSIVGGSGGAVIFGEAANNITFAGDTSGSVMTYVAGGGNETLNSANAEGRVNFFGSTVASSTETVTGSTTGFNYFQTGGGSESLAGGTGTNVFGITEGGANAHITVFDFAAGNDSVNFLGETTQQITDALNSATVTSANGTSDLTVTLSDNTTITFVGITSLSGHVVGGS